MKLSISYPELSDIIKAKTGKDVTVEYVDHKSIYVKTTIKESRVQNALLKKIVDKLLDMAEIDIQVLLQVNSASNDQISVQYDAGKYADKIIAFIGNNVPDLKEYVTFCGDNGVVVLLNRIRQLDDILNKVTIHGIQFAENGAEVNFSLK